MLLGKVATFNISIYLLDVIYQVFITFADDLIELLQSRRGQDNAYIGCMKSGEVVTEE